MKTRFHVWTRGPYGNWEKASAEPLERKSADQLADVHLSSGAEVRVQVLPSNKKPPQDPDASAEATRTGGRKHG
jgi:hypothetical protein